MESPHSRRQWLRSFAALTAGVSLGPALYRSLMAAPVSRAEYQFGMENILQAQIKARLTSNENPYGPSPIARKAIENAIGEANLYPFSRQREFLEVLAEREGLSPDHILVGAGSTESLCLAGLIFGINGGRIISANPTFSTLMQYAEVFGAKWDKVDLNDKLEHNLEAMASAITSDTRLMFVCNPNNPTGTVLPHNVLMGFCEEVSKRVPMYLDEAYLEFLPPDQQQSLVKLVQNGNKNVILTRTFSKIYGMAGLRIGYAVAHPDLIKKLRDHQMGGGLMTVSNTTLAAAQAALSDKEFNEDCRVKNAQARLYTINHLKERGFDIKSSATSFAFFPIEMEGQAFLGGMRNEGVGVRVWDYKGRQWCRVSIGTMDEMKLFTSAIDKVLV
jgi:histidinol-phosphate aminotransferase